MGPSPATGWEGFKQLEPPPGRWQNLRVGPRAEGVGGGPPGGTLVFLEHLGIRLCCTVTGSSVKAPVTEAEAPAPAHS